MLHHMKTSATQDDGGGARWTGVLRQFSRNLSILEVQLKTTRLRAQRAAV